MKRVRDTLEFAAAWLWLNPSERIVIAERIHALRQRHWILNYLAPLILVG